MAKLTTIRMLFTPLNGITCNFSLNSVKFLIMLLYCCKQNCHSDAATFRGFASSSPFSPIRLMSVWAALESSCSESAHLVEGRVCEHVVVADGDAGGDDGGGRGDGGDGGRRSVRQQHLSLGTVQRDLLRRLCGQETRKRSEQGSRLVNGTAARGFGCLFVLNMISQPDQPGLTQ